MKQKRTAIRVHTRKIDRMVAKHYAGSALHNLIKSGEFRKNWRRYAGLEGNRRKSRKTA